MKDVKTDDIMAVLEAAWRHQLNFRVLAFDKIDRSRPLHRSPLLLHTYIHRIWMDVRITRMLSNDNPHSKENIFKAIPGTQYQGSIALL